MPPADPQSEPTAPESSIEQDNADLIKLFDEMEALDRAHQKEINSMIRRNADKLVRVLGRATSAESDRRKLFMVLRQLTAHATELRRGLRVGEDLHHTNWRDRGIAFNSALDAAEIVVAQIRPTIEKELS